MGTPAPDRPMRADARRNYGLILEAARDVFAERGPELGSLDEIARRAGVGPGTLYRHFPSRDVLIEAVYRSAIEGISARAYELLEQLPPGAALDQWMHEHVRWVIERRSLAVTLKSMIDHDSDTFMLCRTIMTDAAGAILRATQESGEVRADLEPRDLLRFGHGIGVACETMPAAADRLLAVALDGMRK
ncbi:TetR/AcrR family transcriptional regulator [Nocardia panacis]|uniref:TetR/AcrR family transcriptional regulator n=1 Tax=Nocardia panacis TaxID=2340916 RepID=A0A3A4K1M0_9NOCA|nr:TetR/AcrR family transcriptional regulator [Nocardia panacis]RJO73640.1 TetR/AcrR family transcriptional regulator [Nocardia panacis]